MGKLKLSHRLCSRKPNNNIILNSNSQHILKLYIIFHKYVPPMAFVKWSIIPIKSKKEKIYIYMKNIFSRKSEGEKKEMKRKIKICPSKWIDNKVHTIYVPMDGHVVYVIYVGNLLPGADGRPRKLPLTVTIGLAWQSLLTFFTTTRVGGREIHMTKPTYKNENIDVRCFLGTHIKLVQYSWWQPLYCRSWTKCSEGDNEDDDEGFGHCIVPLDFWD